MHSGGPNLYGKHGGPTVVCGGINCLTQNKCHFRPNRCSANAAKLATAWHGELQVRGVQKGAGGARLTGVFLSVRCKKYEAIELDVIST